MDLGNQEIKISRAKVDDGEDEMIHHQVKFRYRVVFTGTPLKSYHV